MGSLEDNEKFMLNLLPGLCELETSKGPPKRVKHQGLLFSGLRKLVDLPEDEDTCVREIETKNSHAKNTTSQTGQG